MGQSFLFMLSLFYPIFGMLNLFIGFLQGIGNVITPAVCNITGLGVRLTLAANSCRTARLSIRPLQRGNLLDCGRLSVLQ
ncbi:MAG: hypothetical protein ACLR8Q_01405 [[Ruminococcus] lactaris]|uniref:hypothetical protein n=1 Tax=[Ruminococcus] lactaris TaxID=46228 RepID=UPI0039A3B906